MTTKQIIGTVLLAIPIVGFFVLSVWLEGLKVTLAIFGAAFTVTAIVCLGAYLLST